MEVIESQESAEIRSRRIRKIVVLWEFLTLAGISIVSIFIIWHLKRRSGIVRNQIKMPTMNNHELQLSEVESEDSGKVL